MAAKSKFNVSVTVMPCEIAISIGGLPHMMLRRADISGMQAYIKDVGVISPVYFIEFVTRHGLVVADYDKRDLWEKILLALRGSRLFENAQGAGPLGGSA